MLGTNMLALIGLVYFGYAELTLICQHKRSLNNSNNDNNMNLEWKHLLVCYRRMDWDESFLLCACSANQRALDPVIAEFWVIVVPMAALKLKLHIYTLIIFWPGQFVNDVSLYKHFQRSLAPCFLKVHHPNYIINL